MPVNDAMFGGFAPNLTPAQAAQAIDGAMFVLAAGLIGQRFNNLGAGPFAQPMIFPFATITCGCLPNPPRCPGPIALPEPKAQWTASMTGQHTAGINLGDGYKLNIDERSSEMWIINEKTGEKTRIWGDPHVDVDGKHAFDFWGTTTFTLENGTKVTVNTEQWNGNPNMYVASQVVITKGSNAIVVDGVSQNKLGDVKVTMSNDGRAIDAAHRDGWTLHENAKGSGWLTEAGNIATQADADVTRPGQAYGPGSTMPSLGELGPQLGAFIMFGAMLGLGFAESFDRGTTERAQPKRGDAFNTPFQIV